MKIKNIILAVTFMLFFGLSCSEKLNLLPTAKLSPSSIASSKSNLDKSLVGAYASLTGWNTSITGASAWMTTVTNWVYGDVLSDDALKGSEALDQAPMLELEKFVANPTNVYLNSKWTALFDGIRRANEVIKNVTVSTLTDAEKNQMIAEARCIRAHHYFDAYKLFKNVPYLDENTEDVTRVDNTSVDVLSKVIEDFTFAKSILPDEQAQRGRFSKYAAIAYLGKAYLFQGDYTKAKSEFDAVVASGKFTLLDNLGDIYDPAKKDANTEAVFSVKHSVGDGASDDQHGDYGSILNYVQGGPGGCCGFFLATENLANAHKTRNGLPIDDFTGADANEYNDDTKAGGNMSDFGVNSDDPFTLFAGELDPRLDYTLGRRGVPFIDWGVHPGRDWIRGPLDGTYYTSKKRIISKANYEGSFGGSGAWGEVPTAVDYHVIRYADVLLMLAECEVEVGTLTRAMDLVNMVRTRAKNSPKVQNEAGTADAATYVINAYTSSDNVFSNKDNARKAVRFEKRLETALEGHRFFDIVRWGIIADRIAQKKAGEPVSYASQIDFTLNKNEYLAIPQSQIDLTGGNILEQNSGY